MLSIAWRTKHLYDGWVFTALLIYVLNSWPLFWFSCIMYVVFAIDSFLNIIYAWIWISSQVVEKCQNNIQKNSCLDKFHPWIMLYYKPVKQLSFFLRLYECNTELLKKSRNKKFNDTYPKSAILYKNKLN